jgi:hypothetical protein
MCCSGAQLFRNYIVCVGLHVRVWLADLVWLLPAAAVLCVSILVCCSAEAGCVAGCGRTAAGCTSVQMGRWVVHKC